MKRRNEQHVRRGTTTWRHLRRPKKATLLDLGREFDFTPDHIEALANPGRRSRLFEGDKYLFFILIQPRYEEEIDDIVTRELDVVLTPRQIVTIQNEDFPVVTEIFKNAQESTGKVFMKNSATILSHLMDALTQETYEMLDDMAIEIDALEDVTFSNEKTFLQEVLQMQTNIVDIRKTVENQHLIMDRLLVALPATTRKQLEGPFQEIGKRLDEIQTILSTEMMNVEILHRARETYVNSRTNRLIKLLTLATLITLPASLMAGIFGMNTRHPWILGLPNDFWTIIGLMLGTAVAIMLFVKWRKY